MQWGNSPSARPLAGSAVVSWRGWGVRTNKPIVSDNIRNSHFNVLPDFVFIFGSLFTSRRSTSLPQRSFVHFFEHNYFSKHLLLENQRSHQRLIFQLFYDLVSKNLTQTISGDMESTKYCRLDLKNLKTTGMSTLSKTTYSAINKEFTV